MVAMAHAATIALIDVGYARQRQSATGLANRVIEQVRALPAATVQLGLSATDLATTTDPNITTSTVGGVTRYRYNGEELLTHTPADATAKPPLVPHRVQEKIGPTTYWVSAYTTLEPDGNTVRVTTEVSWVDQTLRQGAAGEVEAQTLVSPGVGCGDSLAQNPYAAPCAAAFEAAAFVDEATITITSNDPTSSFQEATLTLPWASSNLTVGQVNLVQSRGRTSQATLTLLLSTDAAAKGGALAEALTSSDPSAATDPYIAASVGPQGGETLGSTDETNQVWVTTASGDAGNAISTVVARGLAGQPCYDSGPFDQTDHLPCGNATSQQVGIALADLLLPDGTPIPLVHVAPAPEPTAAKVDRTVNPSATTCGLEGCVDAVVSRRLGTVSIGGHPTVATDWLVQLVGLVDSASAGAGEGAPPPAAATAGTVHRQGLVNLDLAALTDQTEGFGVERTFTTGTATIYTVEMAGSFTAAGATADDPAGDAGEPGCDMRCRRTSASATSGSPLRGSFGVRVTTLAEDGFTVVTVADLNVTIDLGRAHARTTYESAPGA
jgi:hypothetical protein